MVSSSPESKTLRNPRVPAATGVPRIDPYEEGAMANEPASERGAKTARPNPNGARTNSRKGPHDPQPGAAVKGKGKPGESPNVAPGGRLQAARGERRPDLIKKRREERLKREERQRRQAMLTKIGLGVIATLLVVAVGVGVANYVRNRGSNDAPAGVKNYAYKGGDHKEGDLQYTEVPPVGGTHNGAWQNCGFYAKPVRSENAVHSLEHGAAWITYRPDLPQDQIDQLKKLAEGQSYLLVSPFPNLPAPVVATSWNHQLQLKAVTDPDLKQFIKVFKQGKDTPEPGATCSGGISTTVG